MLDPLTRAMPPAALVASVLALVVSGAGIGYTAAKIGTKDLQDDSVNSAKVKNASLKQVDMVKEQKYRLPKLGDGVEGDCVWSDAAGGLTGVSPISYRVDRFGTTHLAGLASAADGAGGDGACAGGDEADTVEDVTIYRLPKSARPVLTYFETRSDGGLLIVAGKDGLSLGTSTAIPPGAVVCGIGVGVAQCELDHVSFETKSAGVSSPPSTVPAPTARQQRHLLEQLAGR